MQPQQLVTLDVPYPPTDGTQPCVAEDPELFFPTTSRAAFFQTGRAVAVCEQCPFRRPCLAYAIAWDVAGVWGGTTHDQRAEIRKANGIVGRFAGVTMRNPNIGAQIDRLTAEGLSGPEIAEQLGISTDAVYSRRYAASRRDQP